MCKSIILACEDKMDEDREKDHLRSKVFGNSLMSTNGFLFDPWHSTPVKKQTDEGSMAKRTAKSITANQQSSISAMQGSRTQASDLEITTIQKQRTELQLLIGELKDREQELNRMAAAHHRQLQAWEQDRQRVLTLEQRSVRLEDELQKRNEVIRAISKRLKMAEVREQDSRRELSSMQHRMQNLSQRQQHSSQQHQDLEEKNRSLNSSILTLSSQLGQLQVHEEELSSMLKLKDKDLTEATNRILGLTDRLRESESSLKECQARESKTLQETEEYKRRLREARHQNAQLKDELQEKTLENNSQREELIGLRQENQLLRKELALADESESWKEELLALARSKQERTESELLCLTQVCEHQQNDLQLLKLNLETTREALMQYESQRSLVSPGDVTCMYVDCSTPSPQRRTASPGLEEDVPLSKQFLTNQLCCNSNRTEKMSKDKIEKKDKSEKALAAEKEQFVKLQLQSISKCITTTEAPTKAKYGRTWHFLNISTDILLGTHWESGAVTFWSHAVNLPLASNAILSWKFCHMVHKLLRDGHPNTLRDSRGHVPNIKQMGILWGSLHDRYGHIVALYAKFLCIKIDFHCKRTAIPPSLEAPDEVLERAIAVDINEVFEITGEVQDYMDAALVLQETVFRQLESNNTSSTTAVGQCRLAPLVLLIQDCSPLYQFLVKLLFKLHSHQKLVEINVTFASLIFPLSLSQFFEKARSMEFFKTIIQIPDFPDSPPNFLRAASMADYVKPVVVHDQFPDDDDTESQVEAGEGYPMQTSFSLKYFRFGVYNDCLSVLREKEVESMRKELEALRPEVKMFKAEAQRAVIHLKDQVNKLEAELEDQRTHKQMAFVENEQLRMEVEALRAQTAIAASMQASVDDSRVQTAQMHFTRLKEKHAELVTRHADLMRKNTDMVKQLTNTQQAQEELVKAKQQIAEELEQIKQENNKMLEAQKAEIVQMKQELQTRKAEITNVQSALQSKEKTGDQLSSVLVGLQAEKETLMRSLKEQEAELANLRQSSQLHQTTLQQEREQNQREMSTLQSQLQEKVIGEQEQQIELHKLKRELELKRAEALSVQSALQSKEAAGDQLSSVLVGLQAEKETLLRLLKEQEDELAKLHQAAQLHQITLQQERDKYQREIDLLKSQLQEKLQREQEQQLEIAQLKRELEARRAEVTNVQSALHSKETHCRNPLGYGVHQSFTGCHWNPLPLLHDNITELVDFRDLALHHLLFEDASQMLNTCQCITFTLSFFSKAVVALEAGHEMNTVVVGLQAQKETLMRSLKEQEAELANLRQAAQLHQTMLQQEREKNQREMSILQSELHAKVNRELELQQKLQEEQFCLLQCAVVEAEGIILDALAKVDDPMHVRCVCTPEYLINRAETTLVSIDKMQQSHAGYLRNLDDASGLLRSVTQFSHLAADTIVNGAAASHSAPTDQADRLTDNCRDCATHCLQFLKELKLKATLQGADPSAIRYTVQRILNQATDLRRNDADVLKAELADMVDKEMAATSTAIEDAVMRMEEILSQARRDTSGLKLEVNQRLVWDSFIMHCACFLQAIHMLVTAATDLQKDIVESGRGSGSVKDFYAKNSCWTEGLISASKAVGWGATQMVDSADKVVTDRGKYEELIVCSHEIAASTAQLVAASKVKADRSNKKLNTLLQASRHVNDMAAVVVTSTKAGQMQIEDKDPMDFSGMSLIKLKTEEMESQVKVLELENQLSNERQRLGELRKKHYDLAGVPLDQTIERDFDGFVSVLPPVMPEPPLPEPPKPEPPKNLPTKKPSIFKSGSLLKNKVPDYCDRYDRKYDITSRVSASSHLSGCLRVEKNEKVSIGNRVGRWEATVMEGFGSALEKNVADLTVMDVYDIAAVVGQEFERIIDQYGCEALARLMPKVVRVLEILEVLVSRNSISPETEELRLELDKLRLERLDRLEREKKHKKELELVEDVWRGEAQDLLSQIAQLQEENKTLLNNLSLKDYPMTEEDVQRQEGMSERERQVMKKLKEVVDKQRDEIRAKDRELTLKNEDIEALQQQQNRLMKINHDLRHKITVVEAQGKALIEQKVELEAFAQARQQELASLRQEVSRLRERLQGETKSPETEEPPAPPSPAQVRTKTTTSTDGAVDIAISRYKAWSSLNLFSELEQSCNPPLSLALRNRHVLTDDNAAEVEDEDDVEEEAVLLWEALSEEEAGFDPKDPNRPRFTLQELRDVLHERNELKAKVFMLQEEIAYYKSEEQEDDAHLPTPDPSPTLRPRSRNSAQPESGIKRLFSFFSRDKRRSSQRGMGQFDDGYSPWSRKDDVYTEQAQEALQHIYSPASH
ncbi:hypothetical protein QTP86_021232 [Hemibagrus guttatus]|nr:hypothetical protein QTP86_021232 [Hemibagrus guttatus]